MAMPFMIGWFLIVVFEKLTLKESVVKVIAVIVAIIFLAIWLIGIFLLHSIEGYLL